MTLYRLPFKNIPTPALANSFIISVTYKNTFNLKILEIWTHIKQQEHHLITSNNENLCPRAKNEDVKALVENNAAFAQ